MGKISYGYLTVVRQADQVIYKCFIILWRFDGSLFLHLEKSLTFNYFLWCAYTKAWVDQVSASSLP